MYYHQTGPCSKTEDDGYIPVETSPVTVDLTKVPYQKLSEYKFFEGEMKLQNPALNVLPFQPASALFTDYALKKRFIWMPKGVKATFNSDNTVLELPVGAALIKTFYYDNVQNIANVGGTRIVETRVMIRKADGWIFADYIWNDDQTEAFFDLEGSITHIEWKNENDVLKTVDYRIPTAPQCIVCHKSKQTEVTTYIPIGIKPQNLNFDYNYKDGNKNQLMKWIEAGYLDGNFTLPTQEHSTIDYRDTSKSLSLRVRSYVDANCSHCHMTDRHCDYRPMRFAFSETGNNDANMGVCVNTRIYRICLRSLTKL
ncbi:hypothetical protein [Flavobacterium sp. 3HN19-14]|uniref:hypothetical protein n=1 Tax=Flavobacterium sp. 3HN19-14 TaxID=3448133 RepID=UPI003EE3640E